MHMYAQVCEGMRKYVQVCQRMCKYVKSMWKDV